MESKPSRRRSWLITIAMLGTVLHVANAAHASANELFERLVAPCCWTQTLDVHESELATQLRVEIQQRLTKGESPSAIEDDMASRFGERVRALPRAADPLRRVALLLFSLFVLALLAISVIGFRWTRRGRSLEDDNELATDEYDEELERELSHWDDASRGSS